MNTYLKKLLVVLASAAAGAVHAADMEAITFHGYVDNGAASKEGTLITFDFKLYSGEDDKAELLWARRIPVSLDKDGGFYVDLADSTGQRYQATDGRTPSCTTLAAAMARHAELSGGPVWISYEPVDPKVATPPPREGLYYQPVAVRASSAKHVVAAQVETLGAETVTSTGTLVADRIVSKGGVMALPDLRFVAPQKKVTLNPTGAVRLGSLTGFTGVSATDANGTMAKRLPATADADCGRVVRYRLADGSATHETIFYAAGEPTAAPTGATTIYLWTFGKLEDNQ